VAERHPGARQLAQGASEEETAAQAWAPAGRVVVSMAALLVLEGLGWAGGEGAAPAAASPATGGRAVMAGCMRQWASGKLVSPQTPKQHTARL
jgi:hypothetical protein